MAKHADHAKSLDRTRLEILEERAAALARVAEGLEARLAKARKLRERAVAASGPGHDELAERFAAARREAETWLWYLTIQRETNGLRDHRELRERYPLPERLPG